MGGAFATQALGPELRSQTHSVSDSSPSVPTGRWKMDAGESSDARELASLGCTAAKRPGLKQGQRQGPAPKVDL